MVGSAQTFMNKFYVLKDEEVKASYYRMRRLCSHSNGEKQVEGIKYHCKITVERILVKIS